MKRKFVHAREGLVSDHNRLVAKPAKRLLKRPIATLSVVAATSLVIACGGPATSNPDQAGSAPDPTAQTSPTTGPVTAEPLNNDAATGDSGGGWGVPKGVVIDYDYTAPVDTAANYIAAANRAISPQREDLLLKAADDLAQSGKVDQAASVLRDISVESLPEVLLLRRTLVRARLDQALNRHALAMSRLQSIASRSPLPRGVGAETFRMLAISQIALGNVFAAARELMARQGFLTAKEDADVNRASLLSLLGKVDSATLQNAAADDTNRDTAGWVEYALIQRRYTNLSIPDAEMRAWRMRFPRHLADGTLPAPGMASRNLPPLTGDLANIRQIGVLLPLTSNFGSAARAVLDGFSAMHDTDSSADKPQVVVYDIGDESALASVYYDLALREGADFIVGPLGRKGVKALTETRALSVPTLLLGQVDLLDTANSNVFQFGLLPEQEAEQVAKDAIADGRRVAAVLYPDSDWGARMLSAFTEQFQASGGSVVNAQSYAADAVVDQSTTIKRLLGVDNSERRRARIGAIVGVKPAFKARRRQDLDFVFLAGQSKAARLLKPQINFFQGQDLAVYATSHVFSGKFDRVNDADLNGIVFIDMPWMLDTSGSVAQRRQQIQGQWTGQRTGLDRLYAFGVDAYSVVRNLDTLRRNPDQFIDGVSARLSVDAAQRVERSLSRAVFVDGVPRQMAGGSTASSAFAAPLAGRIPHTQRGRVAKLSTPYSQIERLSGRQDNSIAFTQSSWTPSRAIRPALAFRLRPSTGPAKLPNETW